MKRARQGYINLHPSLVGTCKKNILPLIDVQLLVDKIMPYS